MQKILLTQASADMTLARDVITPEGRVLCGKGTVLSEALLERLRKMEVTTITVEGHPVGNPTSPEEETKAIEERCARVANDPFLLELKQILVTRVSADIKEKQEEFAKEPAGKRE